MGWLSAVAVFFIIWWVTLFAVLPFGVRSQAESGHVEPGTEAGAPVAPRIGYKLLLTTGISILVFAVFYFLTVTMGWSVDDLPRIVPDYSSRD